MGNITTNMIFFRFQNVPESLMPLVWEAYVKFAMKRGYKVGHPKVNLGLVRIVTHLSVTKADCDGLVQAIVDFVDTIPALINSSKL